MINLFACTHLKGRKFQNFPGRADPQTPLVSVRYCTLPLQKYPVLIAVYIQVKTSGEAQNHTLRDAKEWTLSLI